MPPVGWALLVQRALAAHAGLDAKLVAQRMMGYTTEELWFTEWEQGGTPFDVPKNYEKFNPVNHVDKWKTPMLVITGEKDFRIPYTQGLASFTALQMRGIPAELLVFSEAEKADVDLKSLFN